MLPDIRAAIAALFAVVGLLMIAFGAVATFRVAQDSHGALQADLTKRGRVAPPPSGQQPVTVIATPGPHIAPFPPLPVVEVKDAPIAEMREAPVSPPPPTPIPPTTASVPPPPAAEPAIGGPLAEARPDEAARAAERSAKRAAAKKARAARLARQRKTARRAVQARAKHQQAATPSYNSFGNSSFGAGGAKQ
jgi:type IV secretory pathway VirB10-like protein